MPPGGMPPGAAPGEEAPVRVFARRCPGNADWYVYRLERGEAKSVQLKFEHDKGDLRLAVYRGEEGTPFGESDRSTSEAPGEAVAITAEEEAAEFYIEVTGTADATNFYELSIVTPKPQPQDQDKEDQEEESPIERKMEDKEKRPHRPNMEAPQDHRVPGGKPW